jgi:hypothetical protein
MLLDTAKPVETFAPAIAMAPRKAKGRKPAVTPAGDGPPQWLTALSPDEQNSVCWHAAEKLELHPVCARMPWSAKAYERVRESVRQYGVLFPLAVDEHCDVLDGRYRLAAAKEIGIGRVPTLSVKTDDPARFVHETKAAREHMNDKMRAALAVTLQKHLKKRNVTERTTKMNAARLGSPAVVEVKARRTANSRKDACALYGVGERDFRTMDKLASKRPDLFRARAIRRLAARRCGQANGQKLRNASRRRRACRRSPARGYRRRAVGESHPCRRGRRSHEAHPRRRRLACPVFTAILRRHGHRLRPSTS